MTNQSTRDDGLSEAQNNYDNDRERIRTRKAALLSLYKTETGTRTTSLRK